MDIQKKDTETSLATTKEVKKWGDSLVITLNDLSEILGVDEGDLLQMNISVLKKNMKGGKKK